MKSVLRSSRVQTQGLLELRAGERAASPHLVDVIDIAPGSKPSRWIGRKPGLGLLKVSALSRTPRIAR